MAERARPGGLRARGARWRPGWATRCAPPGSRSSGPSRAAAEIEGVEGVRQAADGERRRPDRGVRRLRRRRGRRGVHRRAAGRRGGQGRRPRAPARAWWSPSTQDEAKAAVRRMLGERAFGAAGARVVIEERLTGREVSMMALVRRRRGSRCSRRPRITRPSVTATRGPNTGGMGDLFAVAAGRRALARSGSGETHLRADAARARRGRAAVSRRCSTAA